MNKNKLTKKILSSILKFNNERKKILYKKLSRYKKKKIILIGVSYKNNSYSIINSNFKKIFKSQIKIFDDQFELIDFKKKQVIKKLDDLNLFDIFIYNYSNNFTKKIIKNILTKNRKKKLINLSSKNNLYFQNVNSENIFENES